MRTNTRCVRLGLAIGMGLIVAACDDQAEQPDPPDPAPPADVAAVIPGPPGHIPCATASGDVTREIGPDGDSLVLEAEETSRGSRRHALIVPPSAVRRIPVEFRLAHAPEAYVSVQATHQGPATTFDPPLTIRLSYAGCNVPPADTVGLQIYVHENGEWQPVAGSVHHPDQQAVEARRASLSQYALGAG